MRTHPGTRLEPRPPMPSRFNSISDYVSDYVPFVAVVRSYRRQDFPHDLVAGLVVGVVTVPQAVAYAFLAGLPAAAGLYACLLPMVIYALFSSSRQLVVGPVAVAALMVAATVGEHADAYSNEYVGITTVLSLQVGLLLWLLRLFSLGGIVNLLSHPVISGFVNGAAVLIILSQLGAFAGTTASASLDDGALGWLAASAQSLVQINPIALTVGIASLFTIWGVRRYGTAGVRFRRRADIQALRESPLTRTGPLLVAIVGTAGVWAFDLDIDVVGSVAAGLPGLTVPMLDPGLWLDLAPNAALIALVAYVESYSVGKTLASRQRQRIDGNQELIALGAANVSAAFCGAYPVAGSFSRSSINHAAGARTPVSLLVCAAIIVVTLLWLTPLFANLPKAALAAIVIASVASLIDLRTVGHHWRFYRPDFLTHVATFGGVLLGGVEVGLVIGIGVAIVLFMRGSARPHIAVVGRLGDTPHFRNVERYEVKTWANLVAARVDESFYFANADMIESRLTELVEPRPSDDGEAPAQSVQHLLVVMSAVNFIDTTGLEMLQRLTFHLSRGGVAIHLCEVKGPVRDQLEHVAVDDWLSGSVFQTTDDAFNALTEAAGQWVWRDIPERGPRGE